MVYSNCTKCPDHVVLSDPDPNDWFEDDDVKVICKAMKNKSITVGCRPYNIKKECSTPKWCPKIGKNEKSKKAAKSVLGR